MKYTRKPQQPVSVTFGVSWIEEPITIPSVNSLPMDILLKAQANQDPAILAGALPDELSTLLDSASGIETQEFLDTWAEVSIKAENEARKEYEKETARTESTFMRLIRGLS